MTQSYTKPATRKPQTPQQQLASAVERCQAEGIRIVGEGRMKADNSRFWLVAASDYAASNVCYVVHLHAYRLSCNCEAGQRGRICKHRACVYLALKAELEAAFDEAERVAKQEHQAQQATPTLPHKQTCERCGESWQVGAQVEQYICPRCTRSDREQVNDRWDRYQDARQDAAIYEPVATRASRDRYGDRDDYIPGDYYQHAYR